MSQTLIKYICMQKIQMKIQIQYLINNRENVGLNHFNDPKTFIEYLNDARCLQKH